MKLNIFLFALLSFIAQTAYGQHFKVAGLVTDHESDEPLPMATVQLLSGDSVMLKGVPADGRGRFTIVADSAGQYILRVSSLGYKTALRNIHVTGKRNVSIDIPMEQDVVLIGETVVTANQTEMKVVDDTIVYNADAVRAPEGAAIEQLVERLPGAEVDDDGGVKINGKRVTKVLMDGREFAGGDLRTMMKDMPADMVDKVKSYDEKSDMAKLTGIDDGNEQTVLDFTVKKHMKKGFNLNANGGLGSYGRYGSRLMGARLHGNMRYTVTANANNTNDMGFGSRGRRGGGRNGLMSSKSGAFSFNYDRRDLLKADGGISWRHTDNDSRTKNAVENFVNKNRAFSNSLSQNYARNDGWNANFHIKWTPDTLTSITFRPSASYSFNDSRRIGVSASYKADPYECVDDPLSTDGMATLDENELMVNSRTNKSIGYGKRWSAGASLLVHRRLNAKGRNVAVGANFKYGHNDNRNLSASNVRLNLVNDIFGNDSTYQTNRYNLTPARNNSYELQFTYTEPLLRNVFLQLQYKYRHDHSVSDRQTYDFDRLDYESLDGLLERYRDWDGFFGLLDHPLDYYHDEELSRYAEHDNYNHDIDLQLRVVNNRYNFNVGLMMRPQRSYLKQDYRGVFVDTVRNVMNISPTLNFRYRFSKQSDLRINYRGSTQQPDILRMLDITDDSNPLNITKGNPGLKPSFTSNLRADYKLSVSRWQRTITASLEYRRTNNSIENMVTYDDDTGGRTTQPMNINGNWSTNAAFGINTAIDSTGTWRVHSNSRWAYNHYVSYVALERNASSQKNVTHSHNISENISGSYRNKWLKVEVDGSVNYNRTRNMLQERNNMDTWRFAYGLSVDLTMPWGMSLSADWHEHCRRGYSDRTLNTNEMICNMQLSQAFLKRKKLVVMLQMYDLLRQQSNFSRSINATRRSDTEYNAINSYVMLSVQYKLNMYGGKRSRQGDKGSSARRSKSD